MKNIFIEGLQGMGKSTLLRNLSKQLPDYHVYCEGDLCPVELAWCSYMTPAQYSEILEQYPDIADEIRRWTMQEGDRFVVAYTRVLTEYPGFHRHMETFEIYNGNVSLEVFREVIFRRYAAFRGAGNLFECAFLQNIVEDLILFHQQTDEEIMGFYRELFAQVSKEDFLLLYLDFLYYSFISKVLRICF